MPLQPSARSLSVEQINLGYDAWEDRLLLRLRLQGGEIAEAWLSRRLTKGLLPALFKLAEKAIAATDPAVRQELLAYRHDEKVRDGEFEQPFNETGRSLFEDGPTLIAEVKLHTLSGGAHWRLEFLGREGRAMQLNLDAAGLHGVIKLFDDTLPRTGWDLSLPSLTGAMASTGQVVH